MTDQLKFIVQELNKPPFNKSFNLISFDALDSLQLLQALSDTFCAIEAKPVIDVRNEAADETALRLFNSLRLVKFKQPNEADDLSTFRQGLVEGNKHIVYPVLTWLLQRVPDLQKRAYLARFLVRVDVPAEFLADPDVGDLFQKCEELMAEFKEMHRQADLVKTDHLTTEDIRQDIKSMEDEREQLTKRIERLKKKVEGIANRERLLEMAKNLRAEAEREAELQAQKAEQRTLLVHAEQKCQRLQQQIKEIRQSQHATKPEDVVQKLEDEIRTTSYLLSEKLPKEIATKRKAVQELQKVAAQPAIDKSDLDQIQQKIDEVTKKLNGLAEQRTLKQDPTEDKLTIFRQQANVVERKKEAAAELLHEARMECQQLEAQLKEKRNQMRDSEGNEIITATAFKNYVNRLRNKTNPYKKKRQELEELASEGGVLARTQQIVKSQEDQLRKILTVMGKDLDDNASVISDDLKSSAAVAGGDIQAAIKELSSQLAEGKHRLNPINNELKALRQRVQDLSEEYSGKKTNYDTMAASLESGYSRTEQETKLLRSEVNAAETQFFRLEAEKKVIEALQTRAEEEANAAGRPANAGNASDKQKPFRERLNAKINEADDMGKRYRDEQKTTKDVQEDSIRQIKLWRDVGKLMECKKKCWAQAHPNDVSRSNLGVQQQLSVGSASSTQDRWQQPTAEHGGRPRTTSSRSDQAGRVGSGQARPQTSKVNF